MATPETVELNLYLTGKDVEADELLKQLLALLDDIPEIQYSIHVVDVLESPEEALANDIIATPTLQRVLPKPVKNLLLRLESLGKLRVLLRN